MRGLQRSRQGYRTDSITGQESSSSGQRVILKGSIWQPNTGVGRGEPLLRAGNSEGEGWRVKVKRGGEGESVVCGGDVDSRAGRGGDSEGEGARLSDRVEDGRRDEDGEGGEHDSRGRSGK